MKDEVKNWTKFRKGDQKAFAAIFHAYTPVLYHYGIKHFQNQVLVEDTIQDLFLTLWKNRENLSDVASVKYYLIISLRRMLLTKLQHLQRQSLAHSLSHAETLETEETYEAMMIRYQTEEASVKYLSAAIEALSSRQKEAIQLKFFQQKSYQEITAIMGINYQTARKFIYKALSNLRKTLNQETLVK